MDKINLQVIRQSFGRVVYSHKTHEKEADNAEQSSKNLKLIKIVLIILSSTGLISSLILNQNTFTLISSFFITFTLGFTLYQLSFNPEEKARNHRQIAKELWFIREKYTNLIADIINNKKNDNEIIKERDNLIKQLKEIYSFAPTTSKNAYNSARKSLKVNEEMSFTDKEINQFLPKKLHSKNHLVK